MDLQARRQKRTLMEGQSELQDAGQDHRCYGTYYGDHHMALAEASLEPQPPCDYPELCVAARRL